MVTINYPPFAKNRGVGYWLRFPNLWASRRSFLRSDRSNEWRHAFTEERPPPHHRSTSFAALHGKPDGDGFRFLILGDTGEGDESQYGFLPVIRQLDPDFMIINGDIAYPAGREEDYVEGFFQPYNGLGIPIWATPGNHEYYSKNRGREFYEIFCTRRWASRWANAGLRLVPQPATYWELRSEASGLVVLGLDSGMKADLDGEGRQEPDRRQHFWVTSRLKHAQVRGDTVIVLFHIPALKRAKHEKKTHLTTLHQTLAAFDCVRLVVCSHDHNYQAYTPETFAEYLRNEHGAAVAAESAPPYLVVGAGGATLSGTDWSGPYGTADRHPEPNEWNDYAGMIRRASERSRIAKTLLGRIIGIFAEEAQADQDRAQYLCALAVDVPGNDSGQILATPIHLHDLHRLYENPTTFNVTDAMLPPMVADWRARLLQPPFVLRS